MPAELFEKVPLVMSSVPPFQMPPPALYDEFSEKVLSVMSSKPSLQMAPPSQSA